MQIHWPASAKRKGECQMTGKGRQVGWFIYILLVSEMKDFSFQDSTKAALTSEFRCVAALCAGRVCQLCADDRAVEPHPPLHLWDGGVPAYLHIHQQRLEGRGEHKDVSCSSPEWDLQQKSHSSRPGKRCPAKYFRTTNWDTDLFMI